MVDRKTLQNPELSDEIAEARHTSRMHLQCKFIPMLVANVNDGYLPPTALYVINGWQAADENVVFETGFHIDQLKIGSSHTMVFYNFPEPQQVQEALYGAVLIDNVTGGAEYYTLEYGLDGTWVLGSRSINGHCVFGTMDSMDRGGFFKWVKDRIKESL